MSTSRSNRRVIAQDTLGCLEKGSYTLPDGTIIDLAQAQQQAQQQTHLYTPTDSDALLNQLPAPTRSLSSQVEVTTESTLEAVYRLLGKGHHDVLALNFASAKNAGGGFLGGSQAQEESLARSTGLYPCLMEVPEYYQINRQTKSCFYTDHMIYSPQVPLLKDDKGTYRPTLQLASFITAPAVNTGVVQQRESARLPEVEQVMKRRIAKVLAIALEHGHAHLVLGAWGCGVFRNDPAQIAQYFHEVIETSFKQAFATIVFAIYAKDERFIRPFQHWFAPKSS